jgi:hypothetical protein
MRHKKAVISYSKAQSLHFSGAAEKNCIEPIKYTESGPESESGDLPNAKQNLDVLMFNLLAPEFYI